MTTIGVIHFALLLIIVGGSFRLIQYLWPENKLVQALGVIY